MTARKRHLMGESSQFPSAVSCWSESLSILSPPEVLLRRAFDKLTADTASVSPWGKLIGSPAFRLSSPAGNAIVNVSSLTVRVRLGLRASVNLDTMPNPLELPMRLAFVCRRPWLAGLSLFGVTWVAGCGSGTETSAPVANNPAPAAAPAMANNTPQAMMMGQHGAPAAPGTAPVPGMAQMASPSQPTANDPAAAMKASMAAHAGGTANPNAAAAPNSSSAHAGGTATTANLTPPVPGAGNLPGPSSAHAGGTANPAAVNLAGPMPLAAGPSSAHAGGTAANGAAPAAPVPMPAGGHATPPGANVNPVAAADPAAGGNPAGVNPGRTPAEAMAANLAGANPGVGNPAAVGEPGNPQGGQGGASSITGDPGSIEYAISKLISMAKAGDYTGVETIISEKAKGLAAEFREQDLKPTQVENYKTTFDGLQPLNRRAAGGSGVQFTLKKGETFVQITLAKENGSFKIKELQVRDGKIK